MVSPVIRFLRPTAAQMSPARISVISSRLLACIFSRRPMRSVLRGARVQHPVAGLQAARVDADEDQLADERVGHDLEAQRGERLGVVGLADDLHLHVLRVVPDHRRNIERAGQVVDHCVEQRLHALVLECRTAQHREDIHRDGRLADARLQLRLGRLLALEEQVQDLVVGVGDRLDQLVARLLSRLERSAGISSLEYSAPMVSSCHRIAFIVTRSITPRNFASAPI